MKRLLHAWRLLLFILLAIITYLFFSTNIRDYLFRPWIADELYPTFYSYFYYLYRFNSVMEEIPRFFQFFTPLLAGFAGLRYCQRKQSYFGLLAPRLGRQRRLYLREAFGEAFSVAAASYLAYLIFFVVEYIWQRPSSQPFDPDYLNGYFLRDIFGRGLYAQHLPLFHLIAGLFTIFLSVFSLALLSCAFGLLLNRPYKAYIATLLYFFTLTIGLNRLNQTLTQAAYERGQLVPFAWFNYMGYFEPARIICPHSIAREPGTTAIFHPSTPLIVFGNLLPVLLVWIAVLYYLRKRQKERL